MRVLMTADTVSGVWTYALDLIAAMAPMGVETTLVTMGRALSADQWSAAERIAGLTIVETDYKLEWMQNAWDDVDRAGKHLLEVAADVLPHVVHLNSFCHASLDWAAVRAPVLVVGHSCVETWWRAVKGGPTGPEWQTYRERVGQGIHDADVFVASTRAMLHAFSDAHGPHAFSALIHNGRDGSPFRPRAKQDFVLSSGRIWDEAKNIGTLDLASRRIDWPVCVAGEDESPKGWGVRPVRVRCLGRLKPGELAQCMSRASIFALPARYEPFGLSALEAALSGCALVLGDIPSLREVWGDDAVFVAANHPDRLADAVNDLIADPGRRSAMADRARRRALQMTAERMALAYLSLYRRSCGAAGHRRAGSIAQPIAPVRPQEVAA